LRGSHEKMKEKELRGSRGKAMNHFVFLKRLRRGSVSKAVLVLRDPVTSLTPISRDVDVGGVKRPVLVHLILA